MHGQGILMELGKTQTKFGWWIDGEFVGIDPPLEEIKPKQPQQLEIIEEEEEQSGVPGI